MDDDLNAQQQQQPQEDSKPPPQPNSTSSVRGEVDDDDDHIGFETSNTNVQPDKPELTLKEKLVLRERQRRIETERARLKRQFALSGTAEESGDDLNDEEGSLQVDEALQEDNLPPEDEATLGGESMRAHPDEESANDEARRLGFNMERFLRNSDTFNPQLEPTTEEPEKVLMERFLNDPVVVPPPPVEETPTQTEPPSHRSVSFDMEGLDATATPQNQPINNHRHESEDDSSMLEDLNNASMAVYPPNSVASLDVPTGGGSNASDEPRVLRLTEADMQEMASIDEASIGNAPPSDRDEVMSDIGELADFRPTETAISQDTPTTEMESSSQVSGTAPHAVQNTTSSTERHSLLEGEVDESQYLLSAVAASVAANPPSISRGDDEEIEVLETEKKQPSEIVFSSSADNVQAPVLESDSGDDSGERLINRPRRHYSPDHDDSAGSPTLQSQKRNSVNVDGFDYDKNAPASPTPEHVLGESFNDFPSEPWSPAGKMNVSPLHTSRPVRLSADTNHLASAPPIPSPPIHYGTMDDRLSRGTPTFRPESDEAAPLLVVGDDIPPEIITRSKVSPGVANSQEGQNGDWKVRLASWWADLVEDVRLHDEPTDRERIARESQHYLEQKVLGKAFPDRQRAALLTVLLEIPVLLLIVGGSDSLCQLVGRRRFHLLLGFLPVVAAVSGSIGLQSNNLTRRSIVQSHTHADSFRPWFVAEMSTACCLGVSTGAVLGLLAFLVSGFDASFGLALFLAQFLSIVVSAVTGTLAPLFVCRAFPRDHDAWSTVIVTTIQDIVGSFFMVVLSYYFSLVFGPKAIAPEDLCFVAQN